MEDQKVSETGTCVVLVQVSLTFRSSINEMASSSSSYCINQSVSPTEVGPYRYP